MRPKGIVGGRHAAEQKGTGIGSFWFQCNYFGRMAASYKFQWVVTASSVLAASVFFDSIAVGSGSGISSRASFNTSSMVATG